MYSVLLFILCTVCASNVYYICMNYVLCACVLYTECVCSVYCICMYCVQYVYVLCKYVYVLCTVCVCTVYVCTKYSVGLVKAIYPGSTLIPFTRFISTNIALKLSSAETGGFRKHEDLTATLVTGGFRKP